MKWTLRHTDKALDDLTDIHDYIADDNPGAADRLVSEVLAAFDKTADFPELGRAAAEIMPGLRILTRGRYLLLYRQLHDERVVELVRVVHGARDWSNLFGGD